MAEYAPREMTPEWLASIREWVSAQLADSDDPGCIWSKLANMMDDLLAEVERLQAEVTAYENQLTDVENEVERLEGVVAGKDKRIEFLEGQGRLFPQQLWEYRKAARDA